MFFPQIFEILKLLVFLFYFSSEINQHILAKFDSTEHFSSLLVSYLTYLSSISICISFRMPLTLLSLLRQFIIDLNFCFLIIFDDFIFSFKTMRESLKTWNMTVQYWLAANIYRRLSGRASRSVGQTKLN